eukprot:385875-Ditylum_brightwellii.AAC.1
MRIMGRRWWMVRKKDKKNQKVKTMKKQLSPLPLKMMILLSHSAMMKHPATMKKAQLKARLLLLP